MSGNGDIVQHGSPTNELRPYNYFSLIEEDGFKYSHKKASGV